MTDSLARFYQFFFPILWGRQQLVKRYFHFNPPRPKVWVDYVASMFVVWLGVINFRDQDVFIGNIVITLGLIGLMQNLYADHKARTYSEYYKDSFGRWCYEASRKIEASMTVKGNPKHVVMHADATLDLRHRPYNTSHVVRIVRTIEMAEGGKVIKVIGDQKLSVDDLKLSCRFTDAVLTGWYENDSGRVVGFIRKADVTHIPEKFLCRIDSALETGDLPADDPAFEYYIRELMKRLR